MRWLFRIALTLVCVGLLALATIPYLPTLLDKTDSLLSDWRQVDNKDQVQASTETTAEPAEAAPPRRAVVVPKNIPTGEDSVDLFLQETRRRAEQDPESTLTWLQSQPNGPLRLRGMLEVVALWAAEDSENALLWLESNAQGIARLETLNSGVALWAQQDPQAAAAWIDGMANDGSKLAAAKALASNWINSSPDEAAEWVGSLPNGPLRDEAASALIDTWTINDPENAVIWALSEAEFNGNGELLNRSLQLYAQTAPEDAERFLRGLTEAYDAPDAIESYIRARSENDPADTMAWQSTLTAQDPLNQPQNTRIIMQEWSRTDSVAASSWLGSQTAGPERDAAILGFSDTMLTFEPEAATAWANYISAPEVRAQQLQQSIQSWAKHQPHEALQWVKAAELDPDLRASLAAEIGAD
ncbi:MAG: hypothetical protein ABF330_12480 [Lentimonas sp.]